MATIGNESGRRRILFVASDGSRKTVRLGKVSQRDAEQVCRHVEALAAATIHGQPVSRETALWLRGVGDQLHDRLARAGLATPRDQPGRVTVAGFIDAYLEQRQDVKPASMIAMKQARVWLVRHLGEDCRLDAVSVTDADAYKARMVASKLAKATIAKRLRYARHYFSVAKRRGLIEANPFEHLKGAVTGNPARRVFVPAETVDKVIEQATDAQWKLLIALARYGGLRIPSEALALTWADVDWEHGRFIVRASKTAHHEDGGIRVVPMFPEMVQRFQAVFDEADEGERHVITRYRDAGTNLRTQFQRYIERAGVKPWPKLWQNLRASRATELADRYPSHVCAAWLGHTERIADAFYRSVTDAHFEDAISAAQNPAQQPHVTPRHASQGPSGGNDETLEMQRNATDRESLQTAKVGLGGLEHPAKTCGKTALSPTRGTESGTVGRETTPPTPPRDPDLSRLIDAWPTLNPAIRRAMLAMIQTEPHDKETP